MKSNEARPLLTVIFVMGFDMSSVPSAFSWNKVAAGCDSLVKELFSM